METASDRPVTVVVVTYQSRAVLPGCLATLPAALAGLEWHLVVADNASTDGTLELVRDLYPQAELVRLDGNRGYAAGINAALRCAPPSYHALVLNPDIRLGPSSVRALVKALDDPFIGVAAPVIRDPRGRLNYSLRRAPSLSRAVGEAVLGGRRAGRLRHLGEMITSAAEYESPRYVTWASGAALLISARCRAAVGEWDESFFLYSEETDYQLRAGDAGFRVRFVPEATAVHIGGEMSSSPRLWALRTLNQAELYRRRHGPLSGAAYRGALIVNQAIRALTGSVTHRAALAVLLGSPASEHTAVAQGHGSTG
jgi:GT2 family glycosyltransferase